jgi:putative GTP pyrophosphokinase
VVDSIVFRTKSAESVKKKLVRKGLPINVESLEAQLHDLTGVRIACVFLDDVYKVAERLESNRHFKILRVKDYIKQPKTSGYQSIHMIMEVPVNEERDSMRVEVQLRTVGMNFWAKLDHQLAYKMDDSEEVEKIRRDLKFHAEEIARIDRKLLKIRKKIEKLQDKKIPDR